MASGSKSFTRNPTPGSTRRLHASLRSKLSLFLAGGGWGGTGGVESLESRLLLAAQPYTPDLQPWAIATNYVSWVEAENFDSGGEGVGYHNTTTLNQGGQYRLSEGVGIEGPNASAGGTYNVGYTNSGEWLQYTINVAQAGQYQLNLRTASAGTGGTAHVTFNSANLTGTMTIGATGGWQTYTNTTATVTLTAGVQPMRVYIDQSGFNLDYISLTAQSLITNPPAEQPYSQVRNLPPLLPLWGASTVEAENYNTGGQNVGYYKTNTTQNQHANYNGDNTPFRPADYVSTTNLAYSSTLMAVSNWNTGDWTQYSFVAYAAGTYEMLFNYAIGNTSNAVFSVSANGVVQNSAVTLTPTGDWALSGNFKHTAVVVTLQAGLNVLRIQNISGTANIDNFTLTHATTFGNNGYSWYLPATGGTTHIQAVNFDFNPGAAVVPIPTTGGPANYRPGTGVYTETTADPGSGSGSGYVLGQIQTGEAFSYTIRPELIGRYNLRLRVASAAAGSSFRVLFNGSDRTGVVTVPNTGSAQNWITLNLSVVMQNPVQNLRIVAVTGGFGLHWIELDKETTTAALLADANQQGSYAAEPPDAALNSLDDLFGRVFDKQYDWINRPANAPVPTNDWWSPILESPFAGSLWSYPQRLGNSADGVQIDSFTGTSVTAGNVGTAGTRSIRIDDANVANSFTRDALLDYGDWTVHYSMVQAGSAYMNVTTGRGLPYTWFEFSGMTPALHVVGSFTAYGASGTTLTSSFTADHFRIDNGGEQFGIFAPAGTTFTKVGDGYTVTFSGSAQYLVVGVLPDPAAFELFYQHAYAMPQQSANGAVQSSTYNWSYSAAAGQVVTTWALNTVALKAGANLDTLQGWLPHNYRTIVSGPTLVSGYQSPSIEGFLKYSLGQAFTIIQPANGLSFELPTPATIGGSADYNSAQMAYYLNQYAQQFALKNVYGGDTYWGAKDLQMYAEHALMAQQLHDPNYPAFVGALSTAMTDWFTYTPGETEHYFAYYPSDRALIGFNTAYGSHNYTDNHFHYGYFTSAAGVLAMLDPAWGAQYGALATLVAKQYANWERTDTRFPFLRTFEPWSGHSYAGGMGDARGNNQESTSEAMQSWQGLVLLGTVLGDSGMLAAGMMGFTIEAKAEQEYWFDVHGDLFQNQGYNRSNVAINYDDSKGYGTFFGANPEYILGIENLPLWPSMEFNGQYPAAAQNATSLMFQELRSFYNNNSIVDYPSWIAADPGNGWINITLGYVQQYDPQLASLIITQEYNAGLGIGTDPGTGLYYYQAQAHRTHGLRNWNQHLSLPLGGVYTNSAVGSTTYIVYNPSATDQTVYVYDAGNNVVDSFLAKAHDTTTVLRGTQIPTISISPNQTSITSGGSQQYTASVVDQLGYPLTNAPAIVWSLDPGSLGTLSATGYFSTSPSDKGTATLRATAAGVSSVLLVTVAPNPNYPTGFVSPDPSLSLNAGASITTGSTGTQVLRLTDGNTVEARSAFYATKLDVSHFVTSFSFQVRPGTTLANMAYGFTFALQNQGVTAVGGIDSGMGFSGINNALALRFRFWGENSVGLAHTIPGSASTYTDSLDLTASGITLTSGAIYQAVIAYDGTNLTLRMVNMADASQSFTNTWQVDIPTIVSGNAAYVGFTAGTGGFDAIQEILNWTWDQPVMQITPTIGAILDNRTQQFAVSYTDKYGTTSTNPASLVWSLDAGSLGTLSSTGLYTAPLTGQGSAYIRATIIGGGVGGADLSTLLTVTVAPEPNYYAAFDSLNMQYNLGTGDLGTSPLQGGRLRITEPVATQTRSAYYKTKLNITNFVTNFSFQISTGNTGTNWAEGFTFTLQNQGLTALGGNGGGLGYQGITNSLAIKFDLWDTNGEGTNSVGLYTGGAAPTNLGSLSMPTTSIDLRNTHIFNVTLTYDGTNLVLRIVDASNTSKTYTANWAVNIPALVGGSTAWAGFTGSTGGYSIKQEILTWTWNKPLVVLPVLSPNPRTSSVSSVAIPANRPLTGLDYTDFTLTRDNGANLLTAASTISYNAATLTYTLGGNLATLTAYPGVYLLTLKATGFTDAAGNSLGTAQTSTWIMNAINAAASEAIRLAPNSSTGLLDVFINNNTSTPTYSVNTSTLPSLVLNGAPNATFTVSADLGHLTLLVNASTNVIFAATQKLAALSIANGATVTLATGGTKLLSVPTLNFTGTGRLDLTDNALILTASDPLTLRTWLKNGTLFSSLIPGTAPLTALGYLPGGDYRVLYADHLLNGQIVQPTDLVLKYTALGDVDLNGTINTIDYAQIDFNYLIHNTNATWITGDFNYDGLVDYQDYVGIDRVLANQPHSVALANSLIQQHTTRFGTAYAAALAVPTDAQTPYVNRLYRTLLQREPDLAGQAHWVAQLQQQTLTAAQVATAFVNSLEYRARQIRGYYQSILQRPAEAAGLSGWLAYLDAGHTLEQVQACFYGSAEYAGRLADRGPATLIQSYYQALLSRSAEDAGLASWSAQLAAGTAASTIAAAILQSTEGLARQAQSAYQLHLNRAPTTDETARWIHQSRGGSPRVDLLAGLFGGL